MVASSFKTLERAPVLAPKKKGPAKVALSGVAKLAAKLAEREALDAEIALLDIAVKDRARAHFVATGRAQQGRPERIHAYEGTAVATVALHRRSSASILSSEERELVDHYGIEMETEILYPAGVEIPAAYLDNEDLAARAMELLEAHGFPSDYLVVREAITRERLGKRAIEQVFALPAAPDTDLMLGVVAMLVTSRSEE